ncbi:MAG: thiamine diphosphokinase [Oscillospiraceae bacterium]|nr:thiamine diphosphokinase [Oscillospiraceae bacterium]
MKCVILSGGRIDDYNYVKSLIAGRNRPDLVVCADSGLSHLGKLGLYPLPHNCQGLIVGDADSSDPAQIRSYEAEGFGIVPFPVKKDFTDTELAANEAIKRNCSSILVLGALGGRFDHSVANAILLVKLAKRGVRAVIADENNFMTAIAGALEIDLYDILSSFLGFGLNDGANSGAKANVSSDVNVSASSKANANTYSGANAQHSEYNLSLFAIAGPVQGVTVSGLAYPLDDFSMDADYTTGVSNAFSRRFASVSVKSGYLLVIASRD